MNGLRRRRRFLDAAVAVVLVALLMPLSIGLVQGASGVTAACFIVGSLGLLGAVALRRESPRLTFWVASAAMLVFTLSPSLPGGAPVVMVPLSLLYLVSLYTVVAETAATMMPLLVATAGFVLVLFRTFLHGPEPVDRTAMSAFLVAVVLAVWLSCALGAYQRTRHRYVASLEERARQAEELRDHSVREGVARERERIAHEVHDVVAHSLAVVVTQSDAALMVLDHDPARARPMLEAVLETGRDAMGEIRTALAELSGDHLGTTAPVHSLDNLSVLIDSMQEKGLRVELDATSHPPTVEAEVARAAYRIVQEAVTNALKHGGAEVSCLVRLEPRPGMLTVTVTDDGPGFTMEIGHTGLGLIGMRERARQLGGGIDIASGAEGTTLVARLPIR